MNLRPWTRRMQSEVEKLPDTLAALRESSEHIRKVSEDLTGVAASLRRVTDAMEAMGLTETTELMVRYGEAVRASTAGLEETQRRFEALADTLGRIPGADILGLGRRPR